jgi:hypothetical protein
MLCHISDDEESSALQCVGHGHSRSPTLAATAAVVSMSNFFIIMIHRNRVEGKRRSSVALCMRVVSKASSPTSAMAAPLMNASNAATSAEVASLFDRQPSDLATGWSLTHSFGCLMNYLPIGYFFYRGSADSVFEAS